MELRQLRYFLSILEHGSIGRAAEHLFIVQSALSAQLKKLEDELGCRLLVRSAHGVVVTPSGEKLVPHARLILAQVASAMQEIRQVSPADSRGSVRIGFTGTVGRVLIIPLLEMVEAELPNLTLHLIEALTTDLERLLKSNEIDLAVTFRTTADVACDRERVLREERLYLVSPPSVSVAKSEFETRPIPFSELGAFDLILPSPRLRLRTAVEEEARLHGISLRVKFELDSLSQSLAWINRAGCHSVMMVSTFYKDWLDGNVWAREISPMTMRPKTILTWSSDGVSSSSSAIAELIVRTVDKLRHDGRWPLTIY